MDTSQTEKLLDGMKIPPAPHVLQQLQQEIDRGEPDLPVIADIIAQDVGIAGLILRTVNSPFFGLRAQIQSIQHATGLLGINYTTNIVAGLLLRRTFEQAEGGNPPNFWDSPVNVAMAAAHVARSLGCCEVDEMYMLGLFHNSGHALLMQRFADYQSLMDQHINDPEVVITQVESERFATDHAVLGYFLARSWGLDKHICEIIRDHHNVIEVLPKDSMLQRHASMLGVLKIAEHADKLFWGLDPDHEWNRIESTVLDYLGLSKPDFEELRDDLLELLVSG